jgi:hypothetical protein
MKFKNLKSKPIAAIAVLAILMVPLLLTPLASAQANGTISIYKRGTTDNVWTYPDGSFTPGTTTFYVGVYISDASDVWGWGFDSVTWNPSVVELVNAYEGSYLEDEENPDGPWTTLFVKGNIDNVNGVMVNGIGDAIQDGTDVHSSLASGELCYLKFKIVGVGDANIQFVNPSLCDGETTIFTTTTNPTVTVEGPFAVPEYSLGALAALIAAFASLIAFGAFKKFSLPTFSKHI